MLVNLCRRMGSTPRPFWLLKYNQIKSFLEEYRRGPTLSSSTYAQQ